MDYPIHIDKMFETFTQNIGFKFSAVKCILSAPSGICFVCLKVVILLLFVHCLLLLPLCGGVLCWVLALWCHS